MRAFGRLTLIGLLLLGGCDQRMTNQQKDQTYEKTTLFPDGAVGQPPAEGTVARGDLAAEAVLAARPPLTAALLAEGQHAFGIFCTPCHGLAGYGDGIIVARGMPAPPSFHDDRLRSAPDSHFLDVIEHGYGAMFPYAARVAPAERWPIVAYIRALQLSQHAAVADLGTPLPPELAR